MSRQRRCRDMGDGVIACGGEPTDADRAEIERMRRFARGEMGVREAREYAGLSLGQAAKMLRVAPAILDAIERGDVAYDDLTRARLERLYGSRVATTRREGRDDGR